MLQLGPAKLESMQKAIVDDPTRNLLESAVFAIRDDDDATPIGVCFFVEGRVAITANHNIQHGQSQVSCVRPGEAALRLTVIAQGADLDF